MKYLIRQRDLYWRFDSKGYTVHIGEAGIYDEKAAFAIERSRREPPDILVGLHRSLVNSLEQERDRVRKMLLNLDEMIKIAMENE